MITLVQLAELRSRLRAYVRCGVLGLVNLLVSLETLALSFPAAQDTKGRPCQEAEDLRHPSCKEHVNSNVESDAGRNGDRRHLMMRRREREREREREVVLMMMMTTMTMRVIMVNDEA